MARTDDDETPWTRQLVIGLAALVVAALVIGGVVSVLALGAAKVTGVSGAKQAASQAPSLYIPSGDPTEKLDGYPDPSGRPSATASGSASASPSATPTRKKKKPSTIALQAFPQQVAPGQRITLSGVYKRGEGAQLQVQRFEGGGWTDFPVSARVSGGQFNTYITTSRSGATRFRVFDQAAGKPSNPVRVQIG